MCLTRSMRRWTLIFSKQTASEDVSSGAVFFVDGEQVLDRWDVVWYNCINTVSTVRTGVPVLKKGVAYV